MNEDKLSVSLAELVLLNDNVIRRRTSVMQRSVKFPRDWSIQASLIPFANYYTHRDSTVYFLLMDEIGSSPASRALLKTLELGLLVDRTNTTLNNVERMILTIRREKESTCYSVLFALVIGGWDFAMGSTSEKTVVSFKHSYNCIIFGENAGDYLLRGDD